MTNGRDALHIIDEKISDVRSELRAAARAAAKESEESASFDAQEVDIHKSLADLRLKSLQLGEETASDQIATLAKAEANAQDLSKQHTEYLGARSDAMQSARDALEAAEQHRRQLEKEHETAIEKHDLAAETTRARLYDDPLYIAKADAVETAGAMVEQARIKADAAAAERAEKGAPFEADRFLMYLHDRQYATSSYRAVPDGPELL
ncbi:MAG: hypothetical protein AAGH38_04920, partial [Pseudomonadota bacterium]